MALKLGYRRWPVALGLAAVVEFVLLALWQRNGYWDFSDGVYLLSGRQFLHGLVPYRDFAAAQPPPVYLVGAGLLWVHDGLSAVRAGLALVDLITAGLIGLAVWRMSGRRDLVAAAVLAAPLLPISLHEHAQLIPETLAAPLILGAALTRGRQDRVPLCALLLALACACKLAFVLPALALIVAGPRRGKLGVAFVVLGLLLVAASLLAFGASLWREAVIAQLQIGRTPLHEAAGDIAQGVWNELPLALLAVGALWHAHRDGSLVRRGELLWPLAAAAAAGLVLVLTVFKKGSYIDVLVVADPALLALAVCGAGWLWSERGGVRTVAVVLVAWIAAQSLSLIVQPASPWVATRPFAASGLSWTAGPAAVSALVAVARRCAPDQPYSGSPYLAFLSDRRMPGDQPDTFIIAAAADARFARQATADGPVCPSG